MSEIHLTDTVRNFLSPEGARTLAEFLTAIRRVVTTKAADRWVLDQQRGEIRSMLFFRQADPESGPMIAELSHRIPEGSITAADIPEEHRWLKIKDGQVWTIGDLALIDPDTFYGLDLLLSMTAYHRVNELLRLANPDGWRSWDRWPARDPSHRPDAAN